MNTSLEPLMLFLLAAISGYISGFMSVKINHLLVILLGRLWSSGHAQQRYFVTGAAAAAIYFSFIIFGSWEFAIKVLSSLIFIGLYGAGIVHAEKEFKYSLKIMDKIIEIFYFSSSVKSRNITKGRLKLRS